MVRVVDVYIDASRNLTVVDGCVFVSDCYILPVGRFAGFSCDDKD